MGVAFRKVRPFVGEPLLPVCWPITLYVDKLACWLLRRSGIAVRDDSLSPNCELAGGACTTSLYRSPTPDPEHRHGKAPLSGECTTLADGPGGLVRCHGLRVAGRVQP